MAEATAAKTAEAPESKDSGSNEVTAYGLAADLPDGTPVVSRAGEHAPDVAKGGWFTDEDAVSLDDLKAEEGETSEESSEKKDAASSPPKEEEGKEGKPEAKTGDEKKEGETKASEGGKEGEQKPGEEAKAEEKEETPKKPPKGFVPEAALYEERGKRQTLSQEVAELRRKVSELQSAPPAKSSEASTEEKAAAADKASDLEKTFTQEAAELEKMDPEEEPLAFQKKAFSLLQKMPSLLKATKESVEQGYKSEFNERETSARERAEFQDAIDSGTRLMSHLVPDVNDREANTVLTDFAVKEGGLPVEALRALTHPGTIIMAPNGEPRFLKEDAAYLVSFVNKMYQATQATPDLDQMDVKDLISKRGDDIKAALLEEVKEEAYQKALSELRRKGLGKEDTGYKPIGELPGSEGNESGVDPSVLVSEAEYARMSEKEKLDWLSG